MLLAAMSLTHFQALVLFALMVAVVLACLTKRTTAERIRSALWGFLLFVLIGVAIAWMMFPFSR